MNSPSVLKSVELPKNKFARNLAKSYLNRKVLDLLKFSVELDPKIVEKYINRVAHEAQDLGFSLNYMRSMLYHIKTDVVSEDESEAKIRITCERKRMIHPVFTIIGKLFFIGETYEVDETLNIIKEDGKWKVCGRAFSLSV